MLSADKLRFLRIYHNISQIEMAECIGKSDRWVRKIESGDEIPTHQVYVDWLNACYGRIKPQKKVTEEKSAMKTKKPTVKKTINKKKV